MMDAITSSLPMAMAILVSSVPLMAVTLILVAQRRWPPALAFLLGWAGGMAVVGGLTLVLAQQSAAAGERGPVAWMGLLRSSVGRCCCCWPGGSGERVPATAALRRCPSGWTWLKA